MSARSLHKRDWLLALAGTLLANLFLFSVSPLLVQNHIPRLRPEVYPVTTFLPPQEAPPPEEEDQPPMVTAQIPPPYPFLARRRGIEGWVRVRFLVDRQGQVRELTIVKAQPPGVFEDTVRRTLPRWRFRPGVKDGRPVDTWVETVIRFKLEGR